jgi:hypothetical protein
MSLELLGSGTKTPCCCTLFHQETKAPGTHMLAGIPASEPYRYGLHVWQLWYLTRSTRNSGEDTVQAYYAWREARSMTFAKGLGAAALSILTAWLIPFLKGEYQDASPWLVIAPPLSLVLAMTLVGLMAFQRINVIHQSFIRAMVWLQDLRGP